MFQTKVVDEIKHFTFSNFFFYNRVVYVLMWEKNGTSRQATDGSLIRRASFACCMAKATYIVGSKSFRPDQFFKVAEIKQLCYFST